MSAPWRRSLGTKVAGSIAPYSSSPPADGSPASIAEVEAKRLTSAVLKINIEFSQVAPPSAIRTRGLLLRRHTGLGAVLTSGNPGHRRAETP